MDFSEITRIAGKIPGALRGAFPKNFPKLKNLFSGLSGVPDFFRRTFAGDASFSPGKKRLVPVCLGAAFVVLAVLGVAIFHSPKAEKGASLEAAAGTRIPADELFIPDEPDFVPEYLLERKPRLSWSLEEIVPFWKTPENEEFWRREIKKAVDNLMEGVK